VSGRWPITPLGDIVCPISRLVDVKPGAAYRTIGVKWWGEGAYERATIDGSQTAAQTLSLVRKDDLIINKIWVRHGSTAIASKAVDGCAASGEFPTFELDTSRVLPRWLHWRTKTSTFWSQCADLSRGTSGKNRIKPALFLTIDVPLPPLEEQRRTVARIEELAAKIEEARGLRRQSIQDAAKLRMSSVDQVLESFRATAEEVFVEEVARSVTDGDHQPPPKADSGIPFIFISNIIRGSVDLNNSKWVSPDYFSGLAPSRVPARGDVLYTAVGSYGVPCLVETDEKFCFQRHIAIIKPDRERIMPEYLTWALSSSNVYRQAAKAVTGSAQPTVPLRGIRKLRFPLPCLVEQERSVSHLVSMKTKLDTLAQLQAETAAELDALLPSVLDKAFSGEL